MLRCEIDNGRWLLPLPTSILRRKMAAMDAGWPIGQAMSCRKTLQCCATDFQPPFAPAVPAVLIVLRVRSKSRQPERDKAKQPEKRNAQVVQKHAEAALAVLRLSKRGGL